MGIIKIINWYLFNGCEIYFQCRNQPSGFCSSVVVCMFQDGILYLDIFFTHFLWIICTIKFEINSENPILYKKTWCLYIVHVLYMYILYMYYLSKNKKTILLVGKKSKIAAWKKILAHGIYLFCRHFSIIIHVHNFVMLWNQT